MQVIPNPLVKSSHVKAHGQPESTRTSPSTNRTPLPAPSTNKPLPPQLENATSPNRPPRPAPILASCFVASWRLDLVTPEYLAPTYPLRRVRRLFLHFCTFATSHFPPPKFPHGSPRNHYPKQINTAPLRTAETASQVSSTGGKEVALPATLLA